ncbi:hypothetical protein [Nocardioides sp. SYSU DS0663]|uniref:hypothetical protein n=1 Tax=Nocardioides sp. SYSU DS0663 TaxID=3416445 RepID=UPI003F4B8587
MGRTRRPPRRSWRALTALGAVIVVLALVGGGAAWFSTGGEARPWSEPPVVEGDRLALTYLDSPCQTQENLDVEETPTAVTVTIRTRTWALSCSDVNEQYVVEVDLAEPLGDRVLRDGAE